MIDLRNRAGKFGSKIAFIRLKNVNGTERSPNRVQSQISVHCRDMGVGNRSTKASVSAMKLTYLCVRARARVYQSGIRQAGNSRDMRVTIYI